VGNVLALVARRALSLQQLLSAGGLFKDFPEAVECVKRRRQMRDGRRECRTLTHFNHWLKHWILGNCLISAKEPRKKHLGISAQVLDFIRDIWLLNLGSNQGPTD
jgi:hypothetical protein